MKRKNLKPMIISALLAVGFGATSVGTSFALFTDHADTSINVTAGKVDLAIECKNLKGYSLDETDNTKQKAVAVDGTFTTGGTYVFDANGVLVLSNMVPGDKVTFDIELKNLSNVKTKYRFTSSKSGLLAPYLEATFTDAPLQWTEADVPADPSGVILKTTHVEINFPNHGYEITSRDEGYDNAAQGKQAVYKFGYEMVQGNAQVVDSAPEIAPIIDANTVNEDPTKTSGEYPFSYASNDGLVMMNGTGEDVENPVTVNLATVQPGEETFAIEGINTVSYDIKAENTKDGAPVTVSIYAGEGFDHMYVFHRDALMVENADDTLTVGEYEYNKLTGYVTLMTDSFSPFHFRGSKKKVNFIKDWTEFKTAVAEGGEYVLTADLENPVAADFSNNQRLMIEKDFALNGAGHTIHVLNRGFGITGKEVSFENLTITNPSYQGRCVDTRGGNIEKLSFNNVNLETTSASNVQPLTIGGNTTKVLDLTFKGGSISTSANGAYGYALITFNKINATFEDTTIKGWACFYFKAPDSSYGSRGSIVNVKNSKLVSHNPNSGTTNAFGVMQFEDYGGAVTVNYEDTEIKLTTSGDQDQFFASFASTSSGMGVGIVNLKRGTNIIFSDPLANKFELNLAYSEGSSINITGGTYNEDPSEYVAEGYKAVENPTGVWTVVAK